MTPMRLVPGDGVKSLSSLALAALLALALALAACGDGGSSSGAAGMTAPRLSGAIEIDGSSTVEPITAAVAEDFKKLHNGVIPNVAVSGTGGGFKRFSVGETEISNASRPIKDTEAALAAENGVAYLALRVAVDGLSVVVNPRNDFVSCLTVDELRTMWAPGSTVNRWNQVRPEFPDRPLNLYGPDTDSGTFDYFTEEIVGEAQSSRSDYTPSANDNVLVRGISGDRNALGYFGYAYYIENTDKLKAVAVDDGAGCVAPTDATIEAGEYTPLSRPLFIYVNTEALSRPEVRAFVEYYMEVGAALASEVGYVGLSAGEYQENVAMLG